MKSKYNYKYSKVSQHNYIRNVLPSAIQYPIDHYMIRKKVPWSLVDHSRLTICTNTTILQVAWVRMPPFTFLQNIISSDLIIVHTCMYWCESMTHVAISPRPKIVFTVFGAKSKVNTDECDQLNIRFLTVACATPPSVSNNSDKCPKIKTFAVYF